MGNITISIPLYGYHDRYDTDNMPPDYDLGLFLLPFGRPGPLLGLEKSLGLFLLPLGRPGPLS